MVSPDLVSFDHAVAARGRGGATESGDLSLVRRSARGFLVSVIDGLGHGEEAALAAAAAGRLLQAAADQPLPRLIEACHATLRATRGAAMTLVELDTRAETLSWIAVGNVEGLVVRANEDGTYKKFYVLPRSGIVGHRLPPLRDAMLPLRPGDLIFLATDGIAAGFDRSVDLAAAPQHIADSILKHHAKPIDDALVLVGRWHGAGFRQ